MILKVLGSESSGNCYILQSDTGTLILEAGIRLSEVKKALNFDLSNVVGGLCSHVHGDHFKYANDYAKAGIGIYTGSETIDAYNPIHTHRFHAILAGVMIQLESFRIVPFSLPHNVPCFGYLISHPESGKIMFATDFNFIPHKFIDLSQILIETNFSDAELTNDRAVGLHCSLDTCLAFLRANDLSKVQNIVLLHLSAQNSNARDFTKSVYAVAPNAGVWVGDRGLEISLSRFPF